MAAGQHEQEVFVLNSQQADLADHFRSIPGLPSHLFRTVYNCTRAREIAARGDTLRSQAGTREERAMTIMVATLEAHKDHAALLRAVPAILSERPDFRLLLLGEG